MKKMNFFTDSVACYCSHPELPMGALPLHAFLAAWLLGLLLLGCSAHCYLLLCLVLLAA